MAAERGLAAGSNEIARPRRAQLDLIGRAGAEGGASPPTCSVPMELPGATVLPEAAAKPAMVPLPPRVAPLPSAISAGSRPFTRKVPSVSSTGPEKRLEPVRFRLPGPSMVSGADPVRVPLSVAEPSDCRLASEIRKTERSEDKAVGHDQRAAQSDGRPRRAQGSVILRLIGAENPVHDRRKADLPRQLVEEDSVIAIDQRAGVEAGRPPWGGS